VIGIGGSGPPRLHFVKARQFDKKFDAGKKDMIEDLDLSTFKRPNQA